MSVRASVAAGAIAGLLAGLAFALAHAFIITPIWNRMAVGLVFGVIAGAVAGWALGELMPEVNLRRGLTYGLLLWLSVVPVTLSNAALRANGFAYTHRTLTDAIAIVLALAGGITLGWIRGRRWRAVLSSGIAAVVVTMAMGGPVPVGRSVRAVEILFGVLLASLLGGAVVGLLAPRIGRASGGGPC